MNYKFSRPMDYKTLRPGMIVTSRDGCKKIFTARISGENGWFDFGYNHLEKESWVCDSISIYDEIEYASFADRKLLEDSYPAPDMYIYLKGLCFGNQAVGAYAVCNRINGDGERVFITGKAFYFEDAFLTKTGPIDLIQYHGHVQAELYALKALIETKKNEPGEPIYLVISNERRTLSLLNGFYCPEDKLNIYGRLFPTITDLQYHLTKSMTKKENDRYLQALTNKAYEALYNCKTIDIQSL